CHGAANEAQAHRRWRVVIEDRPGPGGGREGRIRWIGEIEGEGLVRLVHDVAVDGNGDGFGRLARIKGKRGGWDGHVIRRGGGGAVGRGITDGDRSAAGGGQRHGEVGVGGPAVAFCDRHIIDRQRGKWIVVEDR